jgi:hypothetical protein
MKLIELQCVPFGLILVNPEHIGSVVPASSDPYQGHYNQQAYGCCILVQGKEYRVAETALAVTAMMAQAPALETPAPVHVAPPVYGPTPESIQKVTDAAIAEAVKKAFPKKGKKK